MTKYEVRKTIFCLDKLYIVLTKYENLYFVIDKSYFVIEKSYFVIEKSYFVLANYILS